MNRSHALKILVHAAVLPVLLLGAGAPAQVPKPVPAQPDPAAASRAPADAQPVPSAEFMRASRLIGLKLRDGHGRVLGEVEDLIVERSAGSVRYAIVAWDPGVFKSEKVYGVPLARLSLDAQGKGLAYAAMAPERLDAAGITRNQWKDSSPLGHRNFVDNLDKFYAAGPAERNARFAKASDLIGMDVNSREGRDIGDVKELVLDLRSGVVRYAILAFDPSWVSPPTLYAFSLQSFWPTPDRDELVLDIDRGRLATMKGLDARGWEHPDALRAAHVNRLS